MSTKPYQTKKNDKPCPQVYDSHLPLLFIYPLPWYTNLVLFRRFQIFYSLLISFQVFLFDLKLTEVILYIFFILQLGSEKYDNKNSRIKYQGLY